MNEKKEYIERGALLNDHLVEVDRDEGYEVFRPFIYADDIEMFPAADVEPVVRGEWEKRELSFGTFYRCSICGETISGFPMYKYCYNCGAHMERSGSGER